MSQVKLLKIGSDGVPLEMNTAADDITLASYSVTGGGPVMSATGIDYNGQSASDLASVLFTDPTTGFINQTAGNLIANNIMAKDRSNLMTTASDILFPVVTNTAGQLDAFRLPQVASNPSASPTNSAAGLLVYNTVTNSIWQWTGTAWDDTATVLSAQNIEDSYTAGATIAVKDIVYLSANDSVTPARADVITTADAIGFATAGAASAAVVTVRKAGILTGFTGLVAGTRYYLDTAVAGAYTATLPTASGSTVCLVGRGRNVTTMEIFFQQLGRRA